VDHPASLLVAWRERAAYLEQFGDPTSARLWKLAALELDTTLKALGDESLTLVEAAALSGYSADHLGHLVRHRKLRNVGRKNAPRIRRADLPIKSPTRPGRPTRPLQHRQEDGGRVTNISKLTRRKR